MAIRDHLMGLGYAPPRMDDVERVIRLAVTGRAVDAHGVVTDVAWRQACGVGFFDDKQGEPELDECYMIVETGPVRALAEKLLLSGVTPVNVATVLNLRANVHVSKDGVKLFRDGFWDVESLTSIDFRNYYQLSRKERPERPKTAPLTQSAAMVMYSEGMLPGEDDLSTDDIVRSIQVASYVKFTEAQAKPNGSADAAKWANLALKASTMQRADKHKSKNSKQLPVLKPLVHYPDQDVPTIAELEASVASEGDDP